MEHKVTIKVNGKKLVINKFVRDVTSNVVSGLVAPLHDAEEGGKIEVILEPMPKRDQEESQE
ncbi:MAG TPA: hypothetical protein ENN41_04895 [Sediminispirochaeta sp.]|nr:hypothetical protein [Sediminispirochaeta sp.]